MVNYNIPKNRRKKSSGGVTIDNPLMKLIATIIVFGLGVMLAGMIALKLYLISLPPIKILNSLKPTSYLISSNLSLIVSV